MSRTTFEPDVTLATIAMRRAGASRVLQRHGLDFCCRGGTTLDEACRTHGIDRDALAAELDEAEGLAEAPAVAWDERPLALLIEHLITRYHAAHRADLPHLAGLARKVESVHAGHPSCPTGLADHLEQMAVEMERHMCKEEDVLFELIATGQGRLAAMPVQVLTHEHDDHAVNLRRLRALAHDFEPPLGACSTWTALYLGLAKLEREVMEHISLENNVLFPRAPRG